MTSIARFGVSIPSSTSSWQYSYGQLKEVGWQSLPAPLP
jgi:hypothetical protein